MRRLIIIAATIAALSFTGVASAGGYFNTARQTFYSDFIHVRATYDVYDGNGYCVEDEYGFYEDLTCGVGAERHGEGIAPSRTSQRTVRALA